MIQVTIRYGVSSINKEVPSGTTYRSLVQDSSIRGALGYGESVNAVVDGDTIDLNDIAHDGDVIQIEKRAASKAA